MRQGIAAVFFLRNKLGTGKNLTDIRVKEERKIGRGCSPGTSSSLHDGQLVLFRIIYKMRHSDRRIGFLLRGKRLRYSAALEKQKFYTR